MYIILLVYKPLVYILCDLLLNLWRETLIEYYVRVFDAGTLHIGEFIASHAPKMITHYLSTCST